jgi:hypothetical protein
LDYVRAKEQLVEMADQSTSIRKTTYVLRDYCYLTSPSLGPKDVIEVSWFYPDGTNPKMFELYSVSVKTSKKVEKLEHPKLEINTTAYKFNRWLSNNADHT